MKFGGQRSINNINPWRPAKLPIPLAENIMLVLSEIHLISLHVVFAVCWAFLQPTTVKISLTVKIFEKYTVLRVHQSDKDKLL